ncbi:hypothetical protein VNO77_27034 [Canavalia gladiata]|uniref:Uncharacterized protein n=1 Tax=Canavalia gladiata TaxID=3824 RepID=A0AAN9KW74_CANGL
MAFDCSLQALWLIGVLKRRSRFSSNADLDAQKCDSDLGNVVRLSGTLSLVVRLLLAIAHPPVRSPYSTIPFKMPSLYQLGLCISKQPATPQACNSSILNLDHLKTVWALQIGQLCLPQFGLVRNALSLGQNGLSCHIGHTS